MSDKNNGLELRAVPVGRNGTVNLSVYLGSEAKAVEKIDIAKEEARNKFATALVDKLPGIDRSEVDRQLLRLAAEHVNRPVKDAAPPATVGPTDEIDASRIVRPELFITPELSGITIPTVVNIGGEPVPRWNTYLRWIDGRRECQVLPKALNLADNGKLWIMPQPSPASGKLKPGWSSAARRHWLDGVEPVNAADLFRRLSERIAHFVDLPRERAAGVTATLALWSMLTYIYSAFDAVPYLYVGGPAGSGKSRVLDILARLVFRPFVSSSVTGATVFRTLHNQGGVLLFDEAEQLKRANDPAIGETLSVFLAGYKRGGQATRLEPCGDSFKLVAFDVFGPKALACIAGLPPALASRCITVTMFRAAKESDKPRRRIDAEPQKWSMLRDDLHALALEHGPTLLGLADRNDVCPAMRGRDYELWQPLLALAAWIEPQGAKGLLALMQRHAAETVDAGQDDATPDSDETLLRTLADLLRISDRVTASDVLAKVQEAEAAMFKGWGATAVAKHIKRYGVETYKSAGKKVYGADAAAALQKVQAHYGMDLGYETKSE